MIPRRPDWEARLTLYLFEARLARFDLGRFDCTTWAAGAVEAVTGEDVLAPWRGRYSSEEAAAALVADGGWANLAEAAAAVLGTTALERVHDAQRGDLVWAPPELVGGPEQAPNGALLVVYRHALGLLRGAPRLVRLPLPWLDRQGAVAIPVGR